MKKVKFTDCVDIVGSSCRKFSGTKIYVSTGAVDTDHIEAANTETVDYDSRPSRANLVAEENDILFAKMQATEKTLLIDEELSECIYSTGFYAVRAKDNIITNKCLYYLLTSETFLEQKDKNCSGATQKAITNAGLEKVMISIPDLEQQIALTEQLDAVCNMIAYRKTQLSKLDELVKSRFIELFGDPLHPTHSKPLGDVAILERGRFSPRPRNDPRYYGGDYPFIQTGDIASCGHRLSTYRQTLNEKGIHVSKKFPVGTIVIAIVGATIGATAILEIEVYAPDSVIGISVDPSQYNAVFMETLLQFWQPELLRIAPESARANINLGILQNIPIIDTNLQLQEQFAVFVEQTDKSKAIVQQSLEKLETLKKALMQEYFG